MFSSIWSSPIALALVAAFCYGIGSPVMKIGIQHGATPNAMLLAYGIGTLATSFIWCRFFGGSIAVGNFGIGITTLIAVGLLAGIAFVGISVAYALPNGSVTIVTTITATYPILSSAIEIFFMDAKVRPIQALTGCILVIVGGILVATSLSSK